MTGHSDPLDINNTTTRITGSKRIQDCLDIVKLFSGSILREPVVFREDSRIISHSIVGKIENVGAEASLGKSLPKIRKWAPVLVGVEPVADQDKRFQQSIVKVTKISPDQVSCGINDAERAFNKHSEESQSGRVENRQRASELQTDIYQTAEKAFLEGQIERRFALHARGFNRKERKVVRKARKGEDF